MGWGTKAVIKVVVPSFLRIRQATVNVAMEQRQWKKDVGKRVTAHTMKLVKMRLRAVSCIFDQSNTFIILFNLYIHVYTYDSFWSFFKRLILAIADECNNGEDCPTDKPYCSGTPTRCYSGNKQQKILRYQQSQFYLVYIQQNYTNCELLTFWIFSNPLIWRGTLSAVEATFADRRVLCHNWSYDVWHYEKTIETDILKYFMSCFRKYIHIRQWNYYILKHIFHKRLSRYSRISACYLVFETICINLIISFSE